MKSFQGEEVKRFFCEKLLLCPSGVSKLQRKYCRGAVLVLLLMLLLLLVLLLLLLVVVGLGWPPFVSHH